MNEELIRRLRELADKLERESGSWKDASEIRAGADMLEAASLNERRLEKALIEASVELSFYYSHDHPVVKMIDAALSGEGGGGNEACIYSKGF